LGARDYRLYLVVLSLNIAVPVAVILLVALANSLTTVPLTPEAWGLWRGIIGLLVGVGGASNEQAVAIALVDRAVSYWSLIALGFLLFSVTRRR
jgi:uncharacterized protein (TIRG00374 family)